MNSKLMFDRSESNPMLMGVMELMKEDTQALQEQQKALKEAMDGNEAIVEMMEQHKKAAAQLQQDQQAAVGEKVKESAAIAELLENHKKEQEEMKVRHRQELEKAMSEDATIMELVKQQNMDVARLQLQQQQEMNQKVNTLPEISEYVNNVKNARKALQERQQMFDQEMMKAVYMTPVMITPEPETDEEGNVKVVAGSKVSLQMLPFKDKGMLMAFTDSKEFKKWNNAEGVHTLSMTMQDFFAAVLSDAKLAGVMINPLSAHIIIPRERIEMMVKAAAGQRQKVSKNVEVVEADINE